LRALPNGHYRPSRRARDQAQERGINLAACHACILQSETICEHNNGLLDRALLIGTPEDPSIGFFSEALSL
jgi:hypothetical protein